MPTITCPRCDGRLDVSFEQLPLELECPLCRAHFLPLGGEFPVVPRRRKKKQRSQAVLPPTAAEVPSAAARPKPLPPHGKLVLAIEGQDGAGKSTLVTFMKKLCDVYSRQLTRIPRRGPHADPLVARISRLLHEEGDRLTAPGEASLRLAREFQRAELAVAAPPGIIVLDRFVLSLFAQIRTKRGDAELFLPLLQHIAQRARLHATIFVQCPFDVARDRVRRREEGTPVRDVRGERMLRHLADYAQEEFRRGVLTGQQWIVENSGPLSLSEETLGRFLVPYLERSEVL